MEVLRRKLTPKKLKRCLNDCSKFMASKEKKVEKISKPKKMECFVAIADYQAQENGELTLLPGLKVEVLEKSETGWWFVNSEDEQGWVPCTYLEPEDGSEIEPAARAESGQEEIFVCITDFAATNDDEISLEKGAAVSVLQKNVDGWFLIRYQGGEGYAPGTCMKKANNAYRMSMAEKSRLSGVEIVGSLQDVSALLNQEKQEGARSRESSPVSLRKSNKTVSPSVIVKQRSLERRGNFRPPPRQNSIKKIDMSITLRPKRGIYVTVCDFEGSVADGLSFGTGQKVLVKEKNPTGWWFVKTTHEEGWVPASYLEPFCGDTDTDSVNELNILDNDYDEDDWIDETNDDYIEEDHDDDDEDDWYAQPDESVIVPTAPSKHFEIQKRPLPEIPPEKLYEKADELIKNPVRKPVTSRGLPPPPAPPDGGKKKEEVSKTISLSKSMTSSTDNLKKPEADSSGNSTDLASVLKAKFESRSAVSGKTLRDESETKCVTQSKPAVPVLSGKVTDLKKTVPHTDAVVKPSLKPSPGFQDRQSNKFSKPLPPSKTKSIIPAKATAQKNSVEKEIPKLPLKPVLKPVASAFQEKNMPSESDQNTVKSSKALTTSKSIAEKAAAFNKPPASPQTKPALASKPSKPMLAAKPKPTLAAKPSKPTLAAKPKLPTKSGQKVSNIASSLNNKLNLQSSQVPAVDKNSNSEQSNKNSGIDSNSGKTRNNIDLVAEDKTPSNIQPAEVSKESGGFYTALFSFTGENEGEISFTEGDEVEFLEFGEDWSYIRLWDEEGWVPTSYFEKI